MSEFIIFDTGKKNISQKWPKDKIKSVFGQNNNIKKHKNRYILLVHKTGFDIWVNTKLFYKQLLTRNSLRRFPAKYWVFCLDEQIRKQTIARLRPNALCAGWIIMHTNYLILFSHGWSGIVAKLKAI